MLLQMLLMITIQYLLSHIFHHVFPLRVSHSLFVFLTTPNSQPAPLIPALKFYFFCIIHLFSLQNVRVLEGGWVMGMYYKSRWTSQVFWCTSMERTGSYLLPGKTFPADILSIELNHWTLTGCMGMGLDMFYKIFHMRVI